MKINEINTYRPFRLALATAVLFTFAKYIELCFSVNVLLKN